MVATIKHMGISIPLNQFLFQRTLEKCMDMITVMDSAFSIPIAVLEQWHLKTIFSPFKQLGIFFNWPFLNFRLVKFHLFTLTIFFLI